MMKTIQRQIQQDLRGLPEDVLQEVWDFAMFLQEKRKQHVVLRRVETTKQMSSQPLSTEPFIGIWKNRQDMIDSSTWVNRLRTNEWTIS